MGFPYYGLHLSEIAVFFFIWFFFIILWDTDYFYWESPNIVESALSFTDPGGYYGGASIEDDMDFYLWCYSLICNFHLYFYLFSNSLDFSFFQVLTVFSLFFEEDLGDLSLLIGATPMILADDYFYGLFDTMNFFEDDVQSDLFSQKPLQKTVYDFWGMNYFFEEDEWLSIANHYSFMDDGGFMDSGLLVLSKDYDVDEYDIAFQAIAILFEPLDLFFKQHSPMFFLDTVNQSYLEPYLINEKLGFFCEDTFTGQNTFPVMVDFKALNFQIPFPQEEHWDIYRFKVLDAFQSSFFVPPVFFYRDSFESLRFEEFYNSFINSPFTFSSQASFFNFSPVTEEIRVNSILGKGLDVGSFESYPNAINAH